MSLLDIVRHRRSVRSFDGNPLSEGDKEKLLSCIEAASNPYDIPIRYQFLSAEKDGLNSPVIVGTDLFLTGAIEDVPHAAEAFGYSFERILLYADSIGVGTTWIAGTMNREAFEKASKLQKNEIMPAVSPLGYPAKRMSIRETAMRKAIKADTRFKFEELFFEKSFDTPLNLSADDELKDVLEMVRWSPSAVNKQPWRIVKDGRKFHFFEKQSKGYVNKSGFDLQKVDIGIAMYHFVLGMENLKKKVTFKLDDPQIPCEEGTFYIATYQIEEDE